MHNTWGKWALKFLQSIPEKAFSRHCSICGLESSSRHGLCVDCMRELDFNLHACQRCAIPLPGEQVDMICGACLKHPPQHDRSTSLLLYTPPTRALIQGLKYRACFGNATLLAGLLATRIRREKRDLPEYLIPVPLHPRRLRGRGFNQSALIAKALQKQLGIPVLFQHCIRTVDTKSQSRLGIAQRRDNVRDVFALQKPIQARHVAIIDDVITTGNTVNELARMLRRAGVEKIEAWSLARA